MNFDATVTLRIMYSAFVNYLRRNGNTKKKGREAFYNILIELCIPIKIVKDNSVSEQNL